MGSTCAIRLGPGAEVREALLGFVRERGIRAACVVSAVGSLTEVPPPPPPPPLPPRLRRPLLPQPPLPLSLPPSPASYARRAPDAGGRPACGSRTHAGRAQIPS